MPHGHVSCLWHSPCVSQTEKQIKDRVVLKEWDEVFASISETVTMESMIMLLHNNSIYTESLAHTNCRR